MIGLEDVGLGVITERFKDEQVRVIENILDLNSDAKAVREITIKIKFKPDPEDREKIDLEATVSSQLAPNKPYISKAIVGIDEITGEVDSVERVPSQLPLFPKPKPKSEKVVEMRRESSLGQ